MSKWRNQLCITPGDPTGVGPEITVKFLCHHLDCHSEQSFQIIGSIASLQKTAANLNSPLPRSSQVTYIDIEGESPGETAFLAIQKAVETISAGKAEALVTGPISKKNLKQAGILASGHTELLELLTRQYYPGSKSKAEMLFIYRNLRMMLLTRHIPLSRVTSELTSNNISLPMETLHQFLTQQAGIQTPQIAVLGVNPHAGEMGGIEESLVITPTIEQLNQEFGHVFSGPYVPDAFFRDFQIDNFPYDAVVATYHDQGLIPFKLIAGYKAVNVTIGLPFIRTSVSHGTALDIAGKGIATEQSLVEAVNVAINLVQTKTENGFAFSV